MEFGCASSDQYAGYIEDDSDLEFSDCTADERYTYVRNDIESSLTIDTIISMV